MGVFTVAWNALFTPEQLEDMRTIPGVPDYSLFVGTSDALVAAKKMPLVHIVFQGDPFIGRGEQMENC